MTSEITILNVLNKGQPIKPPCLTESQFFILKKSKPFFEIYKNFRLSLFISVSYISSYFTLFSFFSLFSFFVNFSAKEIYSSESIHFGRRTKYEKLKKECIQQQKNHQQQKKFRLNTKIMDW